MAYWPVRKGLTLGITEAWLQVPLRTASGRMEEMHGEPPHSVPISQTSALPLNALLAPSSFGSHSGLSPKGGL